jgi:hypothetical protein
MVREQLKILFESARLSRVIHIKAPGNSLLLTLFCVRVNALVVTSSDRDSHARRNVKLGSLGGSSSTVSMFLFDA